MTQEAVEAINLRLFCQSQHQQSFEGNLLSEMNSRDKIVDINDIKQKPILPLTRIHNCTVGNTGEDIFRTASSYLQFFIAIST